MTNIKRKSIEIPKEWIGSDYYALASKLKDKNVVSIGYKGFAVENTIYVRVQYKVPAMKSYEISYRNGIIVAGKLIVLESFDSYAAAETRIEQLKSSGYVLPYGSYEINRGSYSASYIVNEEYDLTCEGRPLYCIYNGRKTEESPKGFIEFSVELEIPEEQKALIREERMREAEYDNRCYMRFMFTFIVGVSLSTYICARHPILMKYYGIIIFPSILCAVSKIESNLICVFKVNRFWLTKEEALQEHKEEVKKEREKTKEQLKSFNKSFKGFKKGHGFFLHPLFLLPTSVFYTHLINFLLWPVFPSYIEAASPSRTMDNVRMHMHN